MKVKVSYYGICTEEIEVDDKFAKAVPAWEDGDDDTYEALTEELHQILAPQVHGDICHVDDENGELIYEL